MKTVIGILLMGCLLMGSCKKSSGPDNGPGNGNGNGTDTTGVHYALDYGDSVLYLNSNHDDYIVSPLQKAEGKYYGYPEGIEIDEKSGDINVSKSETGLRYRISFVPAGKTDSISTEIVISGINFLDGFYKLNGDDSLAHPVYNGKLNNILPGINNGDIFDEGDNCNSNGCSVNIKNGQINLAQTVRNGVFGSHPQNNARMEFDMNYRINDKSGKAANTIRVKLYYFETMADITPEVYDIISSREGTIFGLDGFNRHLLQSVTAANSTTTVMGSSGKSGKPRPPCIFIVGR